jgi:hypothetical protein
MWEMQVAWASHLRTTGQADRATAILTQASRLLADMTATITDPELRAEFLSTAMMRMSLA